MHRRTFITALAAALPALAHAQQTHDDEPPATETPLIEPTNALEFAFVSALTNENMRPIFRRYLLDTHVAMALAGEGADAAPLEVEVREGWTACAIFTSDARVDEALGEETPRIMISGRAAFERLEGKNVVINYRLRPMLTLEPEDVARYLEAPGQASAGPSQ